MSVTNVTPIDAGAIEFMALVDCEAHEVRDIPADRVGVDPLKFHDKSNSVPTKLNRFKKVRRRTRTTKQDDYWTTQPTKVWRPRHP